MAMTFAGITTIGAQTYQKQRYDYSWPTYLTFESLVIVDNAATATYGTTQSPTTDAFVLLDFPLTIGKTWTVDRMFGATVMTNESVTVAGGTFNDCVQVRYLGGVTTVYYWYARNVGLVKGVSVISGSSPSTIELTSNNF